MKMPISSETRAALDLLKEARAKVGEAAVAASQEGQGHGHSAREREEAAVHHDLVTLISVLESPVFQAILNIQDSLRELKRQVRFVALRSVSKCQGCERDVTKFQVHLHPSMVPADFDITPAGELVLNLPNSSSNNAAVAALTGSPPTEAPSSAQPTNNAAFKSQHQSRANAANTAASVVSE